MSNLTITVPKDAVKNMAKDMGATIADAATGAVSQASDAALTSARASIAAAGFSGFWQQGLTLKKYPSGGKKSINAQGWFAHKNNLAIVFQEGRVIRGKPMLWLPLKSTPAKINGRRATPANFKKAGQKMFSVNRPGKRPLLFGALGKGPATPLFVGIDVVTLRKQWRVYEAIEEAASKLPALFDQNLKVD